MICMAEIFYLSSAPVSENGSDDKRSGIFINLTPEARATIKALKLDTGMTQQAAVERVLQWFAGQPMPVRDAVLRKSGDPGAELIKLKMAELTAAGKNAWAAGPVTLEDALRVIRLMTDRIEQIDAARARELKERLHPAGKKRGG